uniref:Uncharacterized protein n=2 Tax=Oryza sativa subsp. japonica TaxID=39947 RepID=Q10CN1_ORYSJ|nr:hypothetical protein [Oryza sativa Japonica Group]ABF98946.1 hypothetical protein LOC_Os03g54840 [Oryza sativa Japonica Group]
MPLGPHVSYISYLSPHLSLLSQSALARGGVGRGRDGEDDGRRSGARRRRWMSAQPPEWQRRLSEVPRGSSPSPSSVSRSQAKAVAPTSRARSPRTAQDEPWRRDFGNEAGVDADVDADENGSRRCGRNEDPSFSRGVCIACKMDLEKVMTNVQISQN